MFESEKILKKDLVYPELSYQIVGCAFEVFNELGPGHSEKIYQKAMAVMFRKEALPYKEQVYHNIKFKDEIVYKGFLDFEVDEKVIVELKKNGYFSKNNIDQVLNYLKSTKMKLAILINFTPEGVKTKRIVNVL